MKNQLSEIEKSKPYSKYYYLDNASLSDSTLQTIYDNDFSFDAVIERQRVNQLLEKGYHKSEMGQRRNKDGSVYVAAFTKMPKVSAEMIDWWFWWHPVEPLRYKIWYPEAHYSTSADFQGVYNDDTLTHAERLHRSVHTVAEDIGIGSREIIIDFMSPSDFGFDVSRFDEANVATIICARVGMLKQGVWTTEICHLVRRTSEGVEMRSRFWIGYELKRMNTSENSFVNKVISQAFLKRRLLPKDIGKHLMYHCIQEYHNLASFLPQLYREEGV